MLCSAVSSAVQALVSVVSLVVTEDGFVTVAFGNRRSREGELLRVSWLAFAFGARLHVASGLPGRLGGSRQMAGAPHDPECRVSGVAWFDPLHGEALTLIKRARALVGHEMFDVQPISVGGQLPGEGIEQLWTQPAAAMLGVEVELVDDLVGSAAAALANADKLPVGSATTTRPSATAAPMWVLFHHLRTCSSAASAPISGA